MSMDWFRSNQKSLEKTPFEVDHFSWSDRSDRKITVPFDHFDSFLFLVAASVYRCSFCDVTVPSRENLLSHSCQAITGKCLVYLFVAFAEKKIIQVKSQSVVKSRLRPFLPKLIIARNFGQHGYQHGLTHAQITQQQIKNGSRTYRKYGRNILLSGFS